MAASRSGKPGPVTLDVRITFIGNATALLACGGVTLLTDPNFLHRGELAYLGHGLMSRRLTEPALSLEQLPPLDAIVLSHLHGDHFDRRAKAGLDKALPLVTTVHGATKLRPQGFAGVVGLRTGESHELAKGGTTVRLTATPARHARGPLQALLPTVNGHVVTFTAGGESTRVWISGDTLAIDDLAQVRDLAPDVGLVHLGGTRVPSARLGVLVTMDGRQGRRALDLVRPRHALPVHHSDYTVFSSPLADFEREVEQSPVPGVQVHRLPAGATWSSASASLL